MEDNSQNQGRVYNLEQSVASISADVENIKGQLPHLATKKGLSDAKNYMIRWYIGTAIALAGLFVMILLK